MVTLNMMMTESAIGADSDEMRREAIEIKQAEDLDTVHAIVQELFPDMSDEAMRRKGKSTLDEDKLKSNHIISEVMLNGILRMCEGPEEARDLNTISNAIWILLGGFPIYLEELEESVASQPHLQTCEES